MRASFAAFKELTARFPDSQYYEDSIVRMRYLNNALGTYEVKVARYYYNRGAYVAAANRAQGTLVNYPQTPSNEDALAVLAQATRSSGCRSSPTTRGDPRQDLSGQQVHHRRRSTSRGGSSGRAGHDASACSPPASSRQAVVAVLGLMPGNCAPCLTAPAEPVPRFAVQPAAGIAARNATASDSSRVRRIGGSACQMRRP